MTVERIGNNVPYLNIPETDFYVSNSTPNTETTVTFYATVLDADNDICDVNFTFGDGAWEVKRQTTANSMVSVTHTFVTAGAYLAYVDATDGQDIMETAGPVIISVAQAEYTLKLVAGWNFVSLPRTGWGFKASTLGLNTNDIVAGWNAATQNYDKTYVVNVSLPFKDFSIESNMGYWILAGGPRTLHIYGAVPTEEQFRTITVPGDEWWNKVVVIDESQGLSLTRQQIIEAVANTYGDASVRPKLNQEFNKLILDKPVGWVNEKKGVKRSTLQDIEFASTRHMAWEILLALEEQMVELFPPIPEYKPPQRESDQ